jgi:type IV pilus assembly protein PilF
MNTMWGIVVLAAVMLVSGCASTAERPQPRPDAARQAAQVNTSLGREYMARGQFEVALEKLKKAIAADPGYGPGHTLIAILYERIGELDRAGKHYREAVAINPDNGDVNNNYGVFLCGRGQATEAEPYFLQAVRDPFYSTPEIAFANAGSCMMEANDLEKAEKYLRRSIEYNNDFTGALLSMAALKYQQGDYLSARAFLQRFEAGGSETAEGLWLGVRIETRLHDTRSARGYRERLLSRFPDSPEAARAKQSTEVTQ